MGIPALVLPRFSFCTTVHIMLLEYRHLPLPVVLAFRPKLYYVAQSAGVAQMVEQLTCNQQVGGSIPFAGSIYKMKTL